MKSGQPLSPRVEIDGKMLADISGEEVEAWMLQRSYVKASDAPTDVPIGKGCQDHGTSTVKLGSR
jgi:monothiol glutaredoxin